MTSEFGKGLAVCLVKFAEHRFMYNSMSFGIFDKWINSSEEDRKEMLSDTPRPDLDYGFPHRKYLKWFVESADAIFNGDYNKKLSQEIEIFMNGASDHLYEIEVPEGEQWDNIRKMVSELRKKGLTIGHGFTENIWTLEDVDKLFELTREIAFQLDKMIGLNPDAGSW